MGRAAVSAAALGVLTPLAMLSLASPGAAAAATYPAHYAAPYLQVASSDVGDMAADKSATGLADYTLAFLVPQSGCTPYWEDNGDPLGAFTSQVQSLQSAGGNVIISSGGAAGGELAVTCTSVTSLEAAYANIVSTYGVTRLDFDIEGATLGNTAANTRRNQALAALQKADPAVTVDYTLPVDPTGMESSATSLLRNAVTEGVKVNLVNIMTMDFGDGENVLADSEAAATASAGQIQTIFGVSPAQAWDMLGLTPIAGQNDDNEDFTQADAQSLESFAASKGVQELAFWEVDQYDMPLGYAYSKTFNQISGGSGGTGGTGGGGSSATTLVGAHSGLCLATKGGATAPKTTAVVATCNGSADQEWTISGSAIVNSASGTCLAVTGNSTAIKATAEINACTSTSAGWTVHTGGTVLNSHSHLCLSVTGGSKTSGATTDIYTCSGSEDWNEG